MSIYKVHENVYNKVINKTKQPNNPKSCEAENHIPVRGQAVSPIVRKMSQPVVTIKEKGILNMCRTMNELEKVVADYRSLTTLLDEVTAQVEDLKREIIGYLDSNNKISETGSNFTVKVSTCERRTLDSKRLEADLGSLSDYQRISQYRRLYVK